MLSDLEIMALTVWAEARGEPEVGQRAVAWVIRNRYENPGWWSRHRHDLIPDDTIAAVCLDPWQFSCWNPSDPNRWRLDDPGTRRRADYRLIDELCQRVLTAGIDDDPTSGSDHYCTVSIAPHTRWAKDRKPTARLGNHLFFKLGLEGKG